MTKMTISMNTSGLRWFDTSPPAGDPECICSHCDQIIPEKTPQAGHGWNQHPPEARQTESRQACAIVAQKLPAVKYAAEAAEE